MSNNQHSGEDIIRKAFNRSLLTIVIMVVAGYAIFQFTQNEPEPEPVTQEQIKAPVIAQQETSEVPEVVFTDITRDAGIHFVHTNGAYGERLLPETMGGGGGFIDYDNDGDQDIILINATYWPDRQQNDNPTSRLYNNDGTGHFTDVSSTTGMAINSYGMGVAVGDYDNDGWDDVYITTLHKNHLLHNEHGKFVDVTETAGVAGFDEDWSGSQALTSRSSPSRRGSAVMG